jgi:hypothetical protein
MKKICSSCGEERDAEIGFNWEYKRLGMRQSRCKYCQAELGRLHYQKDKQTYKDRTRIRKNQILSENKIRLRIYLSNHPCVDCGETDIRLLEFDHVRSYKTANISRLLTQGRNWPIIEAEIAKCEIRCANCHRKRTSERDGNWWRANEAEEQRRTMDVDFQEKD